MIIGHAPTQSQYAPIGMSGSAGSMTNITNVMDLYDKFYLFNLETLLLCTLLISSLASCMYFITEKACTCFIRMLVTSISYLALKITNENMVKKK